MLENINAEELSRPVIPSDVHSGSLDPDPLPQDSKGNTIFRPSKPPKTLLIKNGSIPSTNSSERACSSTKSSAPEFYRKTTGYLGGVILPKQPFGDGEYGGDGLTLEITSSSDYR
jgi:hypothetical protein